MGLADDLSRYHRFEGLRALAYGRELLLRWPRHPTSGLRLHHHPADLDALVARRAEKVARRCWRAARRSAHSAPRPGRAGGGGAVVTEHGSEVSHEIAARVVIVPTARTRASAVRSARRGTAPCPRAWRSAATTSPRHNESWIESHLDLRDESGSVIPGYGWVFPLGDGRVNVGIGILSTFER